jgi:hypothetical protein
VLGLVVAQRRRDLLDLAGEALRLRQGLRVERRLEVLERQGEVEDLDVASVALREGLAHERAHRRHPVHRARGDRAAHDERLPGHSMNFDHRRLLTPPETA